MVTWVDFKQIKTEIRIEQVLWRYGVQLRRITATDLRGRCPLPMHTSARSRDSFSVNLARNVWSCRSQSCMQARGGQPGGNILDLVALLEGCSIRDAALHLQRSRGALPARTVVPSAEISPEPNTPLRFTLQHIDRTHPYLSMRGLKASTIHTFGIGLYGGCGFLSGRIVIPIHNEQGDLMAYVGRAPDDAIPKYRFPKGFRKSLVLFNLHRACATPARDVIVVEGFFDAFTLHQAGYPAVVALMGSTLSPFQAELLRTRFDRALLMLDGDDAGRHGMATITPMLAKRMSVTTIALDDGVQPDQLAPREIRRCVRQRAWKRFARLARRTTHKGSSLVVKSTTCQRKDSRSVRLTEDEALQRTPPPPKGGRTGPIGMKGSKGREAEQMDSVSVRLSESGAFRRLCWPVLVRWSLAL